MSVEEHILEIMRDQPTGIKKGGIQRQLNHVISDKTLQRILKNLVDEGSITKIGERKATTYYFKDESKIQPSNINISSTDKSTTLNNASIFSADSQKILEKIRLPISQRKRVGYKREFLDRYRPNKTFYLTEEIRSQLNKLGARSDENMQAGTYAKKIIDRLLIDLSYNSSRLEGNTYSRLDTEKLLRDHIIADGKAKEETIMIKNHKEAITFLVDNVDHIKFNKTTLLNVHYCLSQELLGDPNSWGNLRNIAVSIGRSVYSPPEIPALLHEYFELILLKAEKIINPFEQSFFAMVQLPYLQPFEDVNKRTSRMALNIPLIKHNMCPLSFVDVSKEDYTDAILAVYELNEVEPLRDVFIWAYARSCAHYDIIKDNMNTVDLFRIKYRDHRKAVMREIIQQKKYGRKMETCLEDYANSNIEEIDIDRFIAHVRTEINLLTEYRIAGLNISIPEYLEWAKGRKAGEH